MNITDPEVLERLEGATVIASVSGGKDSTAMCLRLRELGVEYQCLYLDTGWENAENYRYVRDELPGYVRRTSKTSLRDSRCVSEWTTPPWSAPS